MQVLAAFREIKLDKVEKCFANVFFHTFTEKLVLTKLSACLLTFGLVWCYTLLLGVGAAFDVGNHCHGDLFGSLVQLS